MNQSVVNGPWIVAQLMRIRGLENEVGELLKYGAPQAFVRTRVAELKSQLALLDLVLE